MKVIKTIIRVVVLMAALGVPLRAAAQNSVVNIPDPELQVVIRAALNKPTGDITLADMESLTAIDASWGTKTSGRGAITSLEGLQAARNLRSLNFASTIWWMGSPDPTVLATTSLAPLSALPNLETLDLSFYATTNANVLDGLSGLTNLQTLVLWSTGLASSPFLGSFTSLRFLDLSDNWLTNFSALTTLTNLEVLRLGGNQVSDISFLKGLTSLRSLFLDVGSQVVNVSIPPELSSLRELHLRGSLQTLALPDDLSHLDTVDLSGNGLTDIGFLVRLPNLRKLDIAYNKLNAFPSTLTNLAELNLSSNPIDDFSFLRGMLDLETLNLSNNPFKHGDLEFLRRLPKLRELYLGFGSWPTVVFEEGFESLETLSIPNAGLQSITLVGLPNLRRLNLRENQIATIDLGGARRSLQYLDLSFNPLQDVNFLEGFSQLRVLEMDNYLRTARTTLTLPDGLVSLRELALWPDPWNIDFCPDKCVSHVPSPYTHLGLAASINLAQLVIHGFPKDKVTVLGFWMHPPVRRDNDNISLRINGARGSTVQVQRSANLIEWEQWKTATLVENEAEILDDPSSATLRFYRVLRQ